MPNLQTSNAQEIKINPVSLKQSTLENQKNATMRVITSILQNGRQEIYPTQVMILQDNEIREMNLGEILQYLLEKRKEQENKKIEGEKKDIFLEDVYSQVIGTMKELGIDDFIKTPNVRKASDDIKLVSSIIMNENFLLKLYKIAYKKQLEQIQSRPEGNYSGKDTNSTETTLKEINARLEEIEASKQAA